jgi:hypothetical protein
VAIAVAAAVEADLPELADVAARTFPLACPPSVTPENIAAFIDENLSPTRLRDYLADPDRAVLAAREDGRIVGYLMLIRGVPDDDDVQRAVTLRPAVELSKMYVLPRSRGGAPSHEFGRKVHLAGRQPAKPTGATVLPQARLYHPRHQDLSARRRDRERLRDGAPALTRRGQCQQP